MDSKTFALLATLLVAATVTMNNTEQSNSSWEQYKIKHSKSYNSAEEEAYRMALYLESEKAVAAHNADGTHSHSIETNHFSDLTKEEFRSIYLGYRSKTVLFMPSAEEAEVSQDSVNWVEAGKVQAVKNQGSCGSCWAFSTVSVCESKKAIDGGAKGIVGNFSEQQLVDCSTSFGNSGCGGGLMDYGFAYFIQDGICTEESYPYEATDATCRASTCTKDSFTITGHEDVEGVAGLSQAIQKQPVSIAVDATNWNSYKGGIFSDCTKSLDHGVVLVGYTPEYWLVRNSWGPNWGEAGYIRLAPGNTCGIAVEPSYPTTD